VGLEERQVAGEIDAPIRRVLRRRRVGERCAVGVVAGGGVEKVVLEKDRERTPPRPPRPPHPPPAPRPRNPHHPPPDLLRLPGSLQPRCCKGGGARGVQ